MKTGRRRLAELFGRAGTASLWALLLLVTAGLVNLVGIRMAGDSESWELWMKAHSAWFLAWRVLLYAGTVAGWIWMRRRIIEREPDRATHLRLLRIEIAAVAAFIALEASLLLRSG